jgi:hypothetical protein
MCVSAARLARSSRYAGDRPIHGSFCALERARTLEAASLRRPLRVEHLRRLPAFGRRSSTAPRATARVRAGVRLRFERPTHENLEISSRRDRTRAPAKARVDADPRHEAVFDAARRSRKSCGAASRRRKHCGRAIARSHAASPVGPAQSLSRQRQTAAAGRGEPAAAKNSLFMRARYRVRFANESP